MKIANILIDSKKKTTLTKAKVEKKAPAAVVTKAASVSKGAYTIQLISLSKQKSLNAYMKTNHLEGKLSTVKNKGATMVVYGRYNTMREAEQAVATLPDALMKAGPWPTKLPG